MQIPIDRRTLKSLIRECKNENVFPIFLGNHLHAATSDRIGALLTSLVSEIAEYLAILPEHELAGVVASLPEAFQHYVGFRTSRLPPPELLERIALYQVIALVHHEYVTISEVLGQSTASSVVLAQYPELSGNFDDDGLLQLDERFILHDGGIEYKKHLIHYHQFLRRGFFSNPNFDFLSRFSAVRRNAPENTYRVAVDHDRLMRIEQYTHIFELDRWFGPRFDRQKLDDRNAVGLTIVKRNKNSLFELVNHLDRTEFYWAYHDGTKTLEIEELVSVEHPFDTHFLNRYVHSERDIVRSTFQHLDGAVKAYPVATYLNRFKAQLPREPRCPQKIKLFRIDGDIPLDTWLDLIGHFYKANEMILEYFDPDQFLRLFEERIRDFVAWKAKNSSDS